MHDGAGEHERGPDGRPHRRRMHALVEGVQAQKPERANARNERAGEHEEGRDVRAHSMTSPRSRNFPSAAVETNPRMPITSALSKYSVVFARMPKASTSSIASTYRVSRASTRSCARGP